MNPVGKVRLGGSKVEVTRLGVGGTSLGGLFRDISEESANATVRRAIELGINFFDTAPLYGAGKSELRLGQVLAEFKRDSFVLSTKVGYVLMAKPADQAGDVLFPFENAPPVRLGFDFSYDATMRSLDESRKRLRLDRIDVVHLHDPDRHYADALNGAYRALHDLRQAGAVGAIGAGMNQAEMLAQFARDGDFDCFLLAGRYTLIDHTGLSELLPLCAQKAISIIIGGPYNSGILATGAKPGATFNYIQATPQVIKKVADVEAICARHSVPLKAAALQFVLAHPAVAAVIPGARSAAEVDESFRMLSFPIPPGFWAEMRHEKMLPEEAPIPAETGMGR